jgi:hypothetical protein
LPFDWNALPINDTIRLPWSSECLCLPNEPQPSESIVVIVFFDVGFLQNSFSEATMLTKPEEPRIPLSKGWQGCVNTAVRILVIPITCSGFIRLPARQAQQFLVAHSMVYNLFNYARHLVSAEHHRHLRRCVFTLDRCSGLMLEHEITRTLRL